MKLRLISILRNSILLSKLPFFASSSEYFPTKAYFERNLLFLFIFLGATFNSYSFASCEKEITGTVNVNTNTLSCAEVRLFEAGSTHSRIIEETKTDSEGNFKLSFHSEKGSLLYILVSDPKHPEILLAAAFELKNSSQSIIINELTTVATAYALSQFIKKNEIFGPSPGLKNGFGTIRNLVNLSSGNPAQVISNQQNGVGSIRSTRALQTQNTLANLIATCASNSDSCELLFSLVSNDGKSVKNTFQAIHSISRNPFTQNNSALFSIASQNEVYTPSLKEPPSSWALAIHFIKGGFSAPGRMGSDSKGNIWSNNNFTLPAGNALTLPGHQVSVLNPRGKPILGSPIFSEFVEGSAYGIAIDQKDRAWISSFSGGQIALFNKKGHVIAHAEGFNHPNGMAVDQKGNVWLANGGRSDNDFDPGSVTVFIEGNLEKRVEQFIGIFKPFCIAIDDKGRCWVANSGFRRTGSVTVLELTKDNEIVIVKNSLTNGSLSSPKTIAIDKKGNAWVNNFENTDATFIDGKTFEVISYTISPLSRGWGLAVDGNNQIWASSFANPPDSPLFFTPPIISSLIGSGQRRGETLFSFSNPSLQHLTALLIDSTGNVWVANNWSLETIPGHIVSGDGLVQFIGLATPVTTPLIGQPTNPADQQKKIKDKCHCKNMKRKIHH